MYYNRPQPVDRPTLALHLKKEREKVSETSDNIQTINNGKRETSSHESWT